MLVRECSFAESAERVNVSRPVTVGRIPSRIAAPAEWPSPQNHAWAVCRPAG